MFNYFTPGPNKAEQTAKKLEEVSLKELKEKNAALTRQREDFAGYAYHLAPTNSGESQSAAFQIESL